MIVLNSIVFFILWIILSGRLDLFHLGMGVCASVFTAVACRNLLIREKEVGVRDRLTEAIRFPSYFFWLVGQIFQANLYVLSLAFDRKLYDRIEPQLISFETVLTNELAIFVLANSITLTPGTIVVRINRRQFLVHSITKRIAKGLPGDMERRLAWVFEGRKI